MSIKIVEDKVIPLVKVQWSPHGVEEATWETEVSIRESYPELFLSSFGDQTSFKGGGCDTPNLGEL